MAMTDFEERQLRNLAKAITDAVKLPASRWEKLKIILDETEKRDKIQTLCEFLAWFEE